MKSMLIAVFACVCLFAAVPTRTYTAREVCASIPDKGPYESTADFEARVQKRYPNPVTFRIPITIGTESHMASATYDPDKERVEIEIRSDNPVDSWLGGSGSYIGENAFGVKTQIQKGSKSLDYYHVDHLRNSNITIELPRAKAPKVMPKLALLISMSVGSTRKYSVRSTPTRTDPYDVMEHHANVSPIPDTPVITQVVNSMTGEVYFEQVYDLVGRRKAEALRMESEASERRLREAEERQVAEYRQKLKEERDAKDAEENQRRLEATKIVASQKVVEANKMLSQGGKLFDKCYLTAEGAPVDDIRFLLDGFSTLVIEHDISFLVEDRLKLSWNGYRANKKALLFWKQAGITEIHFKTKSGVGRVYKLTAIQSVEN